MDALQEYQASLLARAERVANELAEAIAAIPESRWHVPVADGGWSPHEIVAHLRDAEAWVYAVRLRRILDEDRPTFAAFDWRHWRQYIYDPDEPMPALLRDDARLREAALARVRRMTPEAWSRTGRHDRFGVRTAQWWFERALAHAVEHVRQLRGAQDR